MKIALIAGFLGSGKTTLLLRLLPRLAARGVKVAVVVNDFGEIGVDADVLAAAGNTVVELYSGCVCCQLTGDLAAALQAVKRDHAPDLVVIEPSGVAEPQLVVDNLRSLPRGAGGLAELDVASLDWRIVTVVDADRFGILSEILSPLMRSQLSPASLVVINKTDLVSPAELARVTEAVKGLAPGAQVVTAGLRDEAALEEILGVIQQ